MGQLSIGLLVVVIIGEALADRRGDLELFDRSTTRNRLQEVTYVLRNMFEVENHERENRIEQ